MSRVWLTIVLSGIGTYAMRAAFLVFAHRLVDGVEHPLRLNGAFRVAQRQAARAAADLEHLRNTLLLRRTHCQQAVAERAVGFDESQALLHGNGVADETHRRIEMRELLEAMPLAQTSRLLCAAADQHHGVVGGSEGRES